MRRLLTGGVLVLALLGISSPAHAETRAEWFQANAVALLNRAVAADDGKGTTIQYGMGLMASGLLYGWQDPRTDKFAKELLATRHPGTAATTQAGTTCNYGLNKAYDAFNDATTNDINTPYTVSMANHAGEPLLAAYLGGNTVVKLADVQCLVSALAYPSYPHAPTDRGWCWAYSLSPNDANEGCVNNVNTGALMFLSKAQAAGLGATGVQKRITQALQYAVSVYRSDASWVYIQGVNTVPQDVDHGSFTTEAMLGDAYWLGLSSAVPLLTRPVPAGSADLVVDQYAIARLRLAGAPTGSGSWSASTGSLWCTLSDQWQPAMQVYMDKQVGLAAAFPAHYAARAARACA